LNTRFHGTLVTHHNGVGEGESEHMLNQRYVSPDLTHFVGRRKRTQDERYRLFKKVLRTGLLKASPQLKRVSPQFRVLQKDPDRRLSSNKAYRRPAVCFCDIPICDLPLHMKKYKEFGIAFSKLCLIDRAAVPILYVPEGGRPSSLPFEGYARGRVASQARCFDEFWTVLNRLHGGLPRLEGMQGVERIAKDLRRVIDFLDFHLVSNLQFFDQRLADSARKNFYMEREWRVYQDVVFSLEEVVRVFVPERFGKRFRSDFPTFDGEVVFADWGH
jgi:hypothetical protein